ncbi:MAG: ACT domain-containing protein, partial [Bacteroidota bacterium]
MATKAITLNLTILVHCPDKVGIISAVTNFFHQKGGNVIYLDQHVDKQAGVFFMRLESEFPPALELKLFKTEFCNQVALPFAMEWSLHQSGRLPKMAIFVSKYNHCLYDLLSRYKSGELQVEIPFILSNHPDLEYIAQQFSIPYYHIPVNKENKATAEASQIALLR